MRIWVLNLPDTKVCIPLLTARYDGSQSKQKVKPASRHSLVPLLGPEHGASPRASGGDIGLEAAPEAQYGVLRARGRRIELALRGSSAVGQPPLIQIASPTFTPTARLEPNGKYIKVVRIPFSCSLTPDEASIAVLPWGHQGRMLASGNAGRLLMMALCNVGSYLMASILRPPAWG